MSRSLDSTQSPLAVRSHLHRIDLVTVTTYTDRAAGTVDETFYFARQTVQYDWGGGSTVEFWPYLQSIGSLSVSVNHLPSPDDTDFMRKPLDFVLSNEYHGPARLINTLRTSHILENATVVWAQVLVDELPSGGVLDLTSLAGTEHTVFYRGRVTRVGPITNETITLHCEVDLPGAEWIYALDDTKNDPADYGRRLPIVYGEAKKVEAIGYEVGWVTTLAEDITSGFTGVAKFTDLSGISGSGNLMRIDGEEVLVTYVSDTTGNITNRAQSSTTAAAHEVGAPVIEMITTATYIVAGHPVSAIDEIYMRSPLDGSLVRLDSGEFTYTKTISDTTTISGETVASVSFTQAQFRAIVEYLAATGGVTQQPDFTIDEPDYLFVPATAYEVWTAATTDCDSLIDSEGGRVLGNTVGSPTNGVKWWWPDDSVEQGTREVYRWRMRAVLNGRAGYDAGDYDTAVEVDENGIPGVSDSAGYIFTNYASTLYGIVATSAWVTPPGGTVVSDLESASGTIYMAMDCFSSGSGSNWNDENFAFVLAGQIGMEVELDPSDLTRSQDVEIDALAAAMGNGIKLYADVDGYVAPTAAPPYKAGAGSLMTKPCDIMRHWIEGRQVNYDWTSLTSGYETGLFDEAYTASISPSGNVTVILTVTTVFPYGSPVTATVTGGGMSSWTLVDSSVVSNLGVYVYRASSGSPGSGTVHLDWSGGALSGASWSIVEFLGTDTTTDDGVVQYANNSTTGTSLTVTLGSFADAENKTFGGFSTSNNANGTVGSGFDEIHKLTDAVPYLLNEFKNENDTTVDITVGASVQLNGVALELAAGTESLALTVDSDSYDDCNTNLGSDAFAFDARTLGQSWAEVLARMAYEARTTLVVEEESGGTVVKLLTANSSYQFPAAAGAVTEWDRGSFTEVAQDVFGVHASRFLFSYAPDWSRGSGEEAFTQVVVANPDTNDLTLPVTGDFEDAEEDFGRRDAEPVGFRCIRVEATAEEIAGYFCHERIRVPARLFAIAGVPWFEAYSLEVGDIIEVTPPWATSAIKSRVIEYRKDPSTEQIELRLVEVE